jgi:glycosyltransferase involved in cell wall biosynthesis
VRAIALLAMYNEERFIADCLENLIRQGLVAYIIDNCSTDRSLDIAESYLGRGVIGIESFPRPDGIYRWGPLLKRKEELANTLDADWFLHSDIDEIRVPPRSNITLAQFFSDADAQGYNAVNFLEFTFVPTRESPDHDHCEFQKTMRWYYPFSPWFPHRLNAWKRQPDQVSLNAGGHRVKFPGLRMYPESCYMRHYLFLSRQHAIRKYVSRQYDPIEVKRGAHKRRAAAQTAEIILPSAAELRTYTSDDELDPSNPRTEHYLDENWSKLGAHKKAHKSLLGILRRSK